MHYTPTFMRVQPVVVALVALLGPQESFAQTNADVGVTGMGLASIQLVDSFYVGGPYLNEGIGGIGPGVGAGVSAITAHGLIVAAEFSTARFKVQQEGRINTGTTRLHDSLLTGLVGYATRPSPTRGHFLIGLARLLDDPTVNGIPQVFDTDPKPRWTVTGGVMW